MIDSILKFENDFSGIIFKLAKLLYGGVLRTSFQNYIETISGYLIN